jgi:dTDP-4-dehydrorhamnose 3,5-epimerase
MKFIKASIEGAFIIEMEEKSDDRGFFARTFCSEEFSAHGLSPLRPQTNFSHNPRAGTLRGFHYQLPPHGEAKTIRCLRGSIYDVLIDLRPASKTYLKWQGVLLEASQHKAFYIPEGCAHGYLTLEDETSVLYDVSASYEPCSEKGIRYDDPLFKIKWPGEIRIVSAKDKAWPNFSSVCQEMKR